MFVGHYAVSFAAKRAAPAVPLAWLFVAVQLVDIAWAITVPLGIEGARLTPGITASNDLDLFDIPWTHSLAMSVLWAAGGYLFAAWRWGTRRAGLTFAAAVLSHWFVDLPVHIPDLPLWPGGPKVGLGLWNHLGLALAAEIALLTAGVALWRDGGKVRWLLLAVLAAIHPAFVFGPPLPSIEWMCAAALAGYLGLAWAAGYAERRALAGSA